MQTSILVLSQTAKSGGIFWPLAKIMGLIMNGIYFLPEYSKCSIYRNLIYHHYVRSNVSVGKSAAEVYYYLFHHESGSAVHTKQV